MEYVYPLKHKIHKSVSSLLAKFGQLVEQNDDHGFALRRSEMDHSCLLAIKNPYWRLVELIPDEIDGLRTNSVTALELFFRYSQKGALVEFSDQIILNCSDLDNKWARKLMRRADRKIQNKAMKAARRSEPPV